MNLPELIDKLHSEQACRDHLTKIRWPNGVGCPKCGSMSVSYIKTRTLYECNETDCRHQFSVKSGTIFHGSRLPLRTWFLAIHRIAESKKGVSANQLKRELGVSYRTAWYLCHRIREALTQDDTSSLIGIVEADETYVKGKGIPDGEKPKRGTQSQRTTPVLGVKERGGKVRAKAVEHVNMRTATRWVNENVGMDTQSVFTDESPVYRKIHFFVDHKSVNHSKEYVDGIVHTNGIESFWSLLKRGMVGSYHHVSPKHLQRYVDEYCWRSNLDEDSCKFDQALRRCVTGNHIKYSELTAN